MFKDFFKIDRSMIKARFSQVCGGILLIVKAVLFYLIKTPKRILSSNFFKIDRSIGESRFSQVCGGILLIVIAIVFYLIKTGKITF